MCDVLVLEDDDDVRNVQVDALRNAGLSVVEAACLSDARAALASLKSCCKVLLVDHDLGEADRANGFDFAREHMVAVPEASAVFVTGRWDLLNGMSPTQRERQLRKPFRLAELVRTVRELIETT